MGWSKHQILSETFPGELPAIISAVRERRAFLLYEQAVLMVNADINNLNVKNFLAALHNATRPAQKAASLVEPFDKASMERLKTALGPRREVQSWQTTS